MMERGHLQYFPPKEIMSPSKNEIFIDAGAYDGRTSMQFIEWAKYGYKKIYAMEPDFLMKHILQGMIELNRLKNIEIVPCGAYSHSGEMCFEEIPESGSSRINEKGNISIEVISIDEMLKGSQATYIKMDIEGAERAALAGAKNTIEQYRPKMAICIYHKSDDLWQIPYSIIEKYPWYKLYIRHYTDTTTETVLYAVERR